MAHSIRECLNYHHRRGFWMVARGGESPRLAAVMARMVAPGPESDPAGTSGGHRLRRRAIVGTWQDSISKKLRSKRMFSPARWSLRTGASPKRQAGLHGARSQRSGARQKFPQGRGSSTPDGPRRFSAVFKWRTDNCRATSPADRTSATPRPPRACSRPRSARSHRGRSNNPTDASCSDATRSSRG